MFVGLGAFDLSSPIRVLLLQNSQQYPMRESLALFGFPTLPKGNIKAECGTPEDGLTPAECSAAKAECTSVGGKFVANKDACAQFSSGNCLHWHVAWECK